MNKTKHLALITNVQNIFTYYKLISYTLNYSKNLQALIIKLIKYGFLINVNFAFILITAVHEKQVVVLFPTMHLDFFHVSFKKAYLLFSFHKSTLKRLKQR